LPVNIIMMIMMMQTTQWSQPPHNMDTSGPHVTSWVSVCLAYVPWFGTIQGVVLCRAHMNRAVCRASFRHACQLRHQILLWSLHQPLLWSARHLRLWSLYAPQQRLATGRGMTFTVGT
jgi:hypothetical protein